jgi:heme/copper-type cytochrome/quinol oxidase subunit 2
MKLDVIIAFAISVVVGVTVGISFILGYVVCAYRNYNDDDNT